MEKQIKRDRNCLICQIVDKMQKRSRKQYLPIASAETTENASFHFSGRRRIEKEEIIQ